MSINSVRYHSSFKSNQKQLAEQMEKAAALRTATLAKSSAPTVSGNATTTANAAKSTSAADTLTLSTDKYQQAIDAKQKEIDLKQKNIDAKTAEINSKTNENSTLQKEIDSKNKENSTLTKDISTKEKQLDDLKKQLDDRCDDEDRCDDDDRCDNKDRCDKKDRSNQHGNAYGHREDWGDDDDRSSKEYGRYNSSAVKDVLKKISDLNQDISVQKNKLDGNLKIISKNESTITNNNSVISGHRKTIESDQKAIAQYLKDIAALKKLKESGSAIPPTLSPATGSTTPSTGTGSTTPSTSTGSTTPSTGTGSTTPSTSTGSTTPSTGTGTGTTTTPLADRVQVVIQAAVPTTNSTPRIQVTGTSGSTTTSKTPNNAETTVSRNNDMISSVMALGGNISAILKNSQMSAQSPNSVRQFSQVTLPTGGGVADKPTVGLTAAKIGSVAQAHIAVAAPVADPVQATDTPASDGRGTKGSDAAPSIKNASNSLENALAQDATVVTNDVLKGASNAAAIKRGEVVYTADSVANLDQTLTALKKTASTEAAAAQATYNAAVAPAAAARDAAITAAGPALVDATGAPSGTAISLQEMKINLDYAVSSMNAIDTTKLAPELSKTMVALQADLTKASSLLNTAIASGNPGTAIQDVTALLTSTLSTAVNSKGLQNADLSKASATNQQSIANVIGGVMNTLDASANGSATTRNASKVGQMNTGIESAVGQLMFGNLDPASKASAGTAIAQQLADRTVLLNTSTTATTNTSTTSPTLATSLLSPVTETISSLVSAVAEPITESTEASTTSMFSGADAAAAKANTQALKNVQTQIAAVKSAITQANATYASSLSAAKATLDASMKSIKQNYNAQASTLNRVISSLLQTNTTKIKNTAASTTADSSLQDPNLMQDPVAAALMLNGAATQALASHKGLNAANAMKVMLA